MKTVGHCPLCNNTKFYLFSPSNKENIKINICSKCKSGVALITGSVVNYSDYGQHWDEKDLTYYKKRSRKTSLIKKILFFILKKKYSASAYILDFGSGCGFFVKNSEINGFENTYGYEVSDRLKKIAINKVGVTKQIENLSEYNNKFDVITMFDVIEHLPPQKINEIISQIIVLMKPGAILLGTTPNFNSLNIKLFKTKDPVIAPPEHTLYFTKKGLETFFNSHKLKKELLLTSGVSSNVFFRNEKFTPSWLENPIGYQKIIAHPLRIIFKIMSLMVIPFGVGYHHYFIYKKL